MAETGPPTFKLVLVGDGGTGKVSKDLREGCLGPLRRWRCKGLHARPATVLGYGRAYSTRSVIGVEVSSANSCLLLRPRSLSAI
jgi:hypothetical protein